MNPKTSFNIGIVLMILAVLVMFFLIGRAAFTAGGRAACHNTDGMALVVGFKCEEIRQPISIGDIPKLEWGFGNDTI